VAAPIYKKAYGYKKPNVKFHINPNVRNRMGWGCRLSNRVLPLVYRAQNPYKSYPYQSWKTLSLPPLKKNQTHRSNESIG
jgi:hypothetical protein